MSDLQWYSGQYTPYEAGAQKAAVLRKMGNHMWADAAWWPYEQKPSALQRLPQVCHSICENDGCLLYPLLARLTLVLLLA
jgi:hypothetical protein